VRLKRLNFETDMESKASAVSLTIDIVEFMALMVSWPEWIE
jgi:hypothetical protein